jgi:hypothetical protein
MYCQLILSDKNPSIHLVLPTESTGGKKIKTLTKIHERRIETSPAAVARNRGWRQEQVVGVVAG